MEEKKMVPDAVPGFEQGYYARTTIIPGTGIFLLRSCYNTSGGERVEARDILAAMKLAARSVLNSWSKRSVPLTGRKRDATTPHTTTISKHHTHTNTDLNLKFMKIATPGPHLSVRLHPCLFPANL